MKLFETITSGIAAIFITGVMIYGYIEFGIPTTTSDWIALLGCHIIWDISIAVFIYYLTSQNRRKEKSK